MKRHHFIIWFLAALIISLLLYIGCGNVTGGGGGGGGGGITIYTLGITVTPEGWGTVEVLPTGEVTAQGTREYVSGTVVIVTAEALGAHVFDHWGGALSGSTATATITMDADKNIIASFQNIYYHLSVSVTPEGSGTVEPWGGDYIDSTYALLTAEAATNYVFSSWEGDASGTSETTAVLMDGNKNVTAHFILGHFSDNFDGTITDNITGKMWVKDPSVLGGVWGTTGSPSTMTWFNATKECEALDYAGHSDWRLPEIAELLSITAESGNPRIDPVFTNTQSYYYWSITTCAFLLNEAWSVYFYDGYATYYDKTLLLNVRPVRP